MTDDDKPPWNDELARQFVGRRIIVGITRLDADGGLLEQQQFHGEVVEVAPDKGIGIRIAGRNDLYWLPPDLRSVKIAPPGEYRFRTTGEVVVDPDLMTTWTINAPRVH